MSNSENHQQVTKGKWGLNKPKTAANCSSDLAFGSDKDFVELVCENGQIVMQGQSSKEKKTPVSAVSTNTTCIIEDGVLPIPPKGGKFSPPVSVAQEFSSNTLAAVGLIQDDDGVPWFNYPFDYSLEREYCSEFFAEMTGTNRNSMPAQTSGVVSDKIATLDNSFISTVNNANLDQGNSYRETLLDSNLGTAVCGTSGVRSSHPIQSPQFQSSTQGARLKPLDFCGSDNFKAPPQLSTPMTGSAIMPHPIKAIQSSANASGTNQCGSVLNFSHFSRPAVLSKSNPHSVGAATGIPMPDPFKEKKRASDNKSIGSSIVDSNGLKPVGSSLKKTTGCNKIGGVHQDSELFVREGMDLGDKTTIRILPNTTKEDVGCQDGWVGRNGYSDQKLRQSSSFAASIAFGKSDSGKTFEPLVASSSVCSGSSAGRTVKNAKHGLKRKFTEIDESGYHSDDVEEESVGLRKPSKSKSTSAKRSRASEVHNLSERRRRDRINEKMRALQELIPNCNKADKASMLDEAIEYLKTLQLQVQMMSMGSGMYMPPMMLPAGIRHMHATHMAHFSPVGVGMGMGVGMGYGMGMLDMGCSSACPMIPMPPMRSPHLPCSSLPGPVALSGIPGSGVPMFGVPGPGLPVAMPGLPFTPFPGCSAKPVSVPEASSEAATLTASGLVQSSVSRSLPDIAKISSVNCENTQQIQKSQGAKGIHLQSNMAHQTGHTKGTEDPNNAETDGVPSSSAAVVDLYS